MVEAQNPLTQSLIVLPDAHTRNLDLPRSALAIGAHPDDVDFGCGATIGKWSAEGCAVSALVLTDGSKGSWDDATSPKELIEERQHEQVAALRHLGVTGEIVFLANVDGELESGMGQRSEVAMHIRRLTPEVVLGHDPWKRYRLHPDHRHAGWLTTDGVVAARDPLFFPEHGLEPHRPARILLWEADEPDHVEDVSGFAELKYEALLLHRSQHESTMHATDDNGLSRFRDRVYAKLSAAGASVGFEHAEVFKLIDDL